MSFSLPQDVLDSMLQEQAHFDHAPTAFFQAWKRGVEIAGIRLFGEGTREGFEQAGSKWNLCPNMPLINKVSGVMSSGEKVFLAAMVSFYNAHDSKALLHQAGIEGLADLGCLDMNRRQVIAALLLHYTGW